MADEKQIIKPEKKALSTTRRSVIYTVALPIVRGIVAAFLPVRYHNAERLLGDAPFIIMGNHQSMLDPIVAALPVSRYQIRFIGKKELWKNKFVASVFNEMNMIPVDRHNTDMEAMRRCMRVLRDGNILGIFPEGTRYHKGLMEELESGVALIALRSRVPLVPVYITGKLKLFRKTDVYIGEPIPMDDLLAQGVNKDTCEQLLHRITATYAEMAKAHTKA